MGRRRDSMVREEIREGNKVVGMTIQIYHAHLYTVKGQKERKRKKKPSIYTSVYFR